MTSVNEIPHATDVHRLTQHCHAWLVPDGTPGWSNAGLITGADASVLVGTSGIRDVSDYLVFVEEQARARHAGEPHAEVL